MRPTPLKLCLLAGALLAAAPAAAGDGLYVRGAIGASFAGDQTGSYDDRPLSVDTDHDMGPAVAGAVGYHVTDNFRLEGEMSYRTNDVDSGTLSIAGTPIDLQNPKGDTTAGALMANAAYDFNQIDAPVVPYVTGGIGLARVEYDLREDGGRWWDDSDTVFAWQLGLGAKYQATESLDIDLGYRYFATDDPSIQDAGGDALESEYQSHTVTLGAQYNF